jgi:hypothetical protein
VPLRARRPLDQTTQAMAIPTASAAASHTLPSRPTSGRTTSMVHAVGEDGGQEQPGAPREGPDPGPGRHTPASRISADSAVDPRQWSTLSSAGKAFVPDAPGPSESNVAGRRWRWDEEALIDLADSLDDLLFEVAQPGLQSVASWVARGLTAYDAVYVALAEERGRLLVTDDQTIVAIAGELARPLVEDLTQGR